MSTLQDGPPIGFGEDDHRVGKQDILHYLVPVFESHRRNLRREGTMTGVVELQCPVFPIGETSGPLVKGCF